MTTPQKPIPYMTLKKSGYPASFWLTINGRNTIGIGAAVIGASYFSGYAVLHSWGLGRYRSIVQLYKNGFETPLNSDTATRCQSVTADLSLSSKSSNMVEFFCVFGMDMFHAGSLKLRSGSIIGVPRHFSYQSKEDIEKNDIMVENKPVEWGSDGGQLLQDSLILSERAQKFAIAREIVMTDTNSPYIHGGLGSSAIMTCYCTTRVLNEKLYGLARPRSFRVLMYSLVGTFAFGLWSTVTDIITKSYEKWADETAGSIGLDYAKGGVEFYSKILERNMALRSLMGPNGEKQFTFYGNDVEFIRQQHVPYTERKRTLEILADKLANLKGTAENSSA